MVGRPYVTMRVPRVIHPGDDFDVEIALDSTSSTRVDSARLTFSGNELAWFHEDFKSSSTHPILSETQVLMEKGLLQEKHRLSATFRVPPGVPASYGGSRATISYELGLTIVIPWWLDVHEAQEVIVTPAAGPRPPRETFVSRSALDSGPFIEVSLEGRVFGRGELLEGAFAVGNLGDRRVLGADIALVGTDRARGDGRAVKAEAHRINLNSVLSITEGRPHPFRLRIPRDAPVSFEAATTSLVWTLEVNVNLSGHMLFLAIPVVIAHLFGEVSRPAEKPARPDIGRQSWGKHWRALADRHGLSLDVAELTIRGSLGQTQVIVARSNEDGHWSGLVADLRWASFGLGLRTVKRRLVLFRDVNSETDSRGRFQVTGREPAQVHELLSAPLREALGSFDEVDVSDDRARVRSLRAAPHGAGLETFVNSVVALAEALAAAGSRIPPPAAMNGFAPAWRSFADEVGARLTLGRMALHDARIEGESFEIMTVFERDPEPKRTLVRLLSGVAPAGAARRGRRAGPPAGQDHALSTDAESLARLPARVRGALEALERQSAALRVEPAGVEIEIEGPIADPASLRPLLQGMLVLLPWIRGETTRGPYR
jgi:hypothetical protein